MGIWIIFDMTELISTIALAETGVNMDIFVPGTGFPPANNKSAGKKKSVRTAKADNYLKPMMMQYALAAVKCRKQSYFVIKYGRLRKRRGHKKAIIAIARTIVACLYHIVSEKKTFYSTDYEKLMDPHSHVERVVLNKNIGFAYLKSFGYDSSKLVKLNNNYPIFNY